MEINLSWVSGAAFVGESCGGYRVVIDGPAEGGGKNLGPRPMEMLLLGMGACTGYDVVSILKKSRQDIIDCKIALSAERADDIPSVFTEIRVHFILIGHALNEKQVERAIHLSAEKYCSASIMLGKTATITHSFDIQEADS
ncbi:MAG: OsmC family protein [Gammaproteobacteria bacterium]